MKKSFFSNNNKTFWYVGYASQEPSKNKSFTEIVRNEETGEVIKQGTYVYTGYKHYVETDHNGFDIFMYECIEESN